MEAAKAGNIRCLSPTTSEPDPMARAPKCGPRDPGAKPSTRGRSVPVANSSRPCGCQSACRTGHALRYARLSTPRLLTKLQNLDDSAARFALEHAAGLAIVALLTLVQTHVSGTTQQNLSATLTAFDGRVKQLRSESRSRYGEGDPGARYAMGLSGIG
jgi:hypothetical protein